MQDVAALGRYRGIKASELTPEQATSLEKLAGDRGSIPAPHRFLINAPFVVDRIAGLGTDLRKHGLLTPRELEIVVLMTARQFGSDFVQAAHRKAGRRVGLADEVIEALLDGREPILTDAREKAVHALTKALHASTRVADADMAAAGSTLGHRMVAEIIGLISTYAATCYTMRFTGATAAEVSP